MSNSIGKSNVSNLVANTMAIALIAVGVFARARANAASANSMAVLEEVVVVGKRDTVSTIVPVTQLDAVVVLGTREAVEQIADAGDSESKSSGRQPLFSRLRSWVHAALAN